MRLRERNATPECWTKCCSFALGTNFLPLLILGHGLETLTLATGAISNSDRLLHAPSGGKRG